MARIVLIAIAATGALLAGCGDSSTSETDPTSATTTVSEQAQARDPVECLEAAGLARARQRDHNVWQADAPDGTFVSVQSVGPGIAVNEVKRSTEMWAYAAGPYFVQGPAKAADGSFTTKVANCLRVGRADQ